VLLIDEASTLGTVQGAALLSEARAAGAMVVMLGDDRQFQAVAHGDALAVVQRSLSEASVDMAQTRRQTEAWQREATRAVRRGDVRAAIEAYREHGCVREFATQAQARAALIERWTAIEREGTPCGIEAFTNAERVSLNALARERWQAMGRLSGEEVVLETMDGRTPYVVGERVVLRERVPKAGLFNGSAGTVRAVDGTTLSIERRDGAVVAVDTRTHPGIQHGYCSTEYREQGSTRYAELQLVTRHVHQRSLVVGMTRHTAAYGMFYAREEVGSYEELVALGLRTRSKDLASDFQVVERGRESGPEEQAPQRSETIVGHFAEVDRERDEERAERPVLSLPQ
jgi:ATP-dependent exoDNAse (exonuclease V) alpha subunit